MLCTVRDEKEYKYHIPPPFSFEWIHIKTVRGQLKDTLLDTEYQCKWNSQCGLGSHSKHTREGGTWNLRRID